MDGALSANYSIIRTRHSHLIAIVIIVFDSLEESYQCLLYKFITVMTTHRQFACARIEIVRKQQRTGVYRSVCDHNVKTSKLQAHFKEQCLIA